MLQTKNTVVNIKLGQMGSSRRRTPAATFLNNNGAASQRYLQSKGSSGKN